MGRLIEKGTVKKGNITNRKRAIVEFYIEDIKYKTWPDVYPNTVVGDCYEVLYVPSSPEIVEDNFYRKVECPDILTNSLFI